MDHQTEAVRWYRERRGQGLSQAAIITGMGTIGATLVAIGASGQAYPPVFVALGALVVCAGLALAVTYRRAGIGVAPDHLIVRGIFGGVRRVPWGEVQGFRLDRPEGVKGTLAIYVDCAGQEPLVTTGCTFQSAGETCPAGEAMVWALRSERESHLQPARSPGDAGWPLA
jgi:hypothetical protein